MFKTSPLPVLYFSVPQLCHNNICLCNRHRDWSAFKLNSRGELYYQRVGKVKYVSSEHPTSTTLMISQSICQISTSFHSSSSHSQEPTLRAQTFEPSDKRFNIPLKEGQPRHRVFNFFCSFNKSPGLVLMEED